MAEIIEQGKCGDNLTWTLDNEGLLTISGEGEMLDYGFVSPFWNNTNITKVKVSHGVTSIGNHAFYGCEALTNITIPTSVTRIGDHAFDGCKALTSIEIPNSVTSIGFYAFEGCEALEYGEYDNGLYLGNKENPYAFLIKTKSTDITACSIKDTCKVIGDFAFDGCAALTSIEIPNSVTSIGDSAFLGCEALTSINVAEDNANYISIDGVLYDKEKKTLIQCPGRKNNIEIPNSVTKIGDSAFGGCEALTSIEIPNSVIEIGERAFVGCAALTSIEIPNSVTRIGEWAFEGCAALTSIEIPNSVTSIGDCAFAWCEALEKAEFASIKSLCSISFKDMASNPLAYAHHLYINGEEVTKIEIPDLVTSIGKSAFSGCKALTSIEIPNSVTSIGDEAFWGCEALTSIEIPNSVTRIGDKAFGECEALTSIEIPNSVTTIEVCAFCKYKGCVKTSEKNKNYKSINGSLLNKEGSEIICAYMDENANCNIPEGVEVIKKAAINNKNVKNIYLPITTVTLEERAFCNAEIENLHIRCEHPENLKIHEEAFYKTNIENCTLYVPIGTGYAYRHHPVFSKFKEVIIEK